MRTRQVATRTFVNRPAGRHAGRARRPRPRHRVWRTPRRRARLAPRVRNGPITLTRPVGASGIAREITGAALTLVALASWGGLVLLLAG